MARIRRKLLASPGMRLALVFAAALTTAGLRAEVPPDVLRVCADPNNPPFSHRDGNGFENRIAELLAARLDRKLEYFWFPQRMGFVPNTLKSWSDETGYFRCDLIIGVPVGFDQSDTTRAYYRSTYALVFKSDGVLQGVDSVAAFDELPAAKKDQLRIGAFNPSPSIGWLRERDLLDNATVMPTLSGDAEFFPGRLLEEQLRNDQLDAVLIWGPIAGDFVRRHPELDLTLLPLRDGAGHRFEFSVAMGIRYGEKAWKQQIEQTLATQRAAIRRILDDYHIPQLPLTAAPADEDDND